MIGRRIRKFREEKGLSISQLADRAGVAKSYLSNIERKDNINPSIHFLEKISSVLEIDLQQLLKEENKDNTSVHPQKISYLDVQCEFDTFDQEWHDLFHEAIESGMSKDEFSAFLEWREFQAFKQWRRSRA